MSSVLQNLPQVIILLGPVGAGKSTVGRILEKELNGHFISIEEFFIEKFGSYENYSSQRDQAYRDLEHRIFAAINAGTVPLIFEEIAISPHGKNLVQKVLNTYTTDLISIEADLETCLARVKERGTTKNFSKSESVVQNTWLAFQGAKQSFNFKSKIWNQSKSQQMLLEETRGIWS